MNFLPYSINYDNFLQTIFTNLSLTRRFKFSMVKIGHRFLIYFSYDVFCKLFVLFYNNKIIGTLFKVKFSNSSSHTI